jgi:hypothetical protein
MTVTITSVVRGQSFWKVTDSLGRKYATKSEFMAAAADRYRQLGTDVVLHSRSGWIYRALDDISPRVSEKVVSA